MARYHRRGGIVSVMVNKYRAPQLRRHYIREWLEHKELSQAELARRMDVAPANVNRWIHEPSRVDMEVISGVADALAMTDASLLLRHPASVAPPDFGALAPEDQNYILGMISRLKG